MRKLLIALALSLFALTAQAGGGGGSKSAPSSPPPPPPPPEPQAPTQADTSNAVSREKTRRLNGGGNQSTLLTGADGAAPGSEDLLKTKLGTNVLLGG